jgi:hypothetical protein
LSMPARKRSKLGAIVLAMWIADESVDDATYPAVCRSGAACGAACGALRRLVIGFPFRRASDLAHPFKEAVMPSPLNLVKEKFGDKAKLVAELEKFTNDGDLWVNRTNQSKGLAHASNAQLLRLHRTFSEVKEKFGSRAKLIDAICEVEKRTKDEGYKTRLGAYPVPRLWDMYKAASKRSGGGAKAGATPAEKAARKKTAAAAKPAAKKAAPAKKPAAKKAAAKKATARNSSKKR